jgi:hypothetical protein
MLHCRRALLSTAITSALSTYPPTPFSISAQSMSRSTYTSAGDVLPSVMSAFCTYRQPPRSRTSSRRVCPLQCFQNFGSVSTFAVARVSTTRGVSKCVISQVHGSETTSYVRFGPTGSNQVRRLGFPWRHRPRRSNCTSRQSDHQTLRIPSLGLRRGTRINIY